MHLSIDQHQHLNDFLGIEDDIYHRDFLNHEHLTVDMILNEHVDIIYLQGTQQSYGHSITNDWMNGKLWSDIKYVFHLNVYEVNLNQYKSFEELLTTEYQGVFQHITFSSLSKMSHQIVIILDGIDEYVLIQKYYDNENIHQPLLEIIDPKYKVLARRHLIITGNQDSLKDMKKPFEHLSSKIANVLTYEFKEMKKLVKLSTKESICDLVGQTIGDSVFIDMSLMSVTRFLNWNFHRMDTTNFQYHFSSYTKM